MIIDIIIMVILAIFAFNGTRRGFITEITMIFALVCGFFFANIFYSDISNFIDDWVSNDSLRMLISYLLIFLVVLAMVRFLAIMLQKFLELVLLGWLNRVLGLLFGILKGFLVITVFIFIIQSIPRAENLDSRMNNDSMMYHICVNLKEWVIDAVRTNSQFEHYRDQLKRQTDEENIQEIIGNTP